MKGGVEAIIAAQVLLIEVNLIAILDSMPIPLHLLVLLLGSISTTLGSLRLLIILAYVLLKLPLLKCGVGRVALGGSFSGEDYQARSICFCA